MGEEKTAYFKKHFHELEYWNSKNTISYVNCNSRKLALTVIKLSCVKQTLKTI